MGLSVEWRSGTPPLVLAASKTLDDLGVACYRSADDCLVTPAIGSMAVGLHPFLALWAVLLALSSLARYEPATWSKMIDIDRSAEANPIEHLLEEAAESVQWQCSTYSPRSDDRCTRAEARQSRGQHHAGRSVVPMVTHHLRDPRSARLPAFREDQLSRTERADLCCRRRRFGLRVALIWLISGTRFLDRHVRLRMGLSLARVLGAVLASARSAGVHRAGHR